MIYIESKNTNPFYNLALEQFVFDSLPRNESYFMLWQNHNSIIVGKHQNTQGEINAPFVKEKNITVARRLSGGGAVYHDLGNLNFTFITDNNTKGIDFISFCKPIGEALLSFGVPVEFSGRNDMTINGKKFSGNAQYIKEGRVMHHGTLLFDSDLSILGSALKPGEDKIESKGVKSVESRVCNIRPFLKTDMNITDFWGGLKNYLVSSFEMKELTISDEQNTIVEKLKENVYSKWSWNYGNSPPYSLRKVRRIQGCGKIEILLDVTTNGIIEHITFNGDFFGELEPNELAKKLIGCHLEEKELKTLLDNIEINRYFHALNNNDFQTLLLE